MTKSDQERGSDHCLLCTAKGAVAFENEHKVETAVKSGRVWQVLSSSDLLYCLLNI